MNKAAKQEIRPQQTWIHKKVDLRAVVERVSNTQVAFTFDGCSCALTKSDFRRRYTLLVDAERQEEIK